MLELAVMPLSSPQRVPRVVLRPGNHVAETLSELLRPVKPPAERKTFLEVFQARLQLRIRYAASASPFCCLFFRNIVQGWSKKV
jgi:hypothetical protein